MAVNIVTGMVGDDHITSHDDRARHAAHFGRGKYVFPVGERFSAEKISENLVRIKDGMCINQGTQMGIEPNDYTDVEIDNGITGVNRHDLICMRYTKNADTGIENASLVVVKGTSGSEPTDPDVIEGNILDGGDLEDDMPLFRVVIEGITITSIVPVFEVFDGGNDKIRELEQEIDSLSDDVTDLNNAMGGISRDVSALQGNVSTLQGGVSSLQSTVANHTTSITGLEGDIDSLGGRMNTAESDIDTLETNQTQILSDIDALEHSLSTTKTATGNPISISDSAHVNAEELKVELEPIQDLHGYDKPWVGGAGKNKLPLVLADIKTANTDGTWNGDTYVLSGMSYSVLTDGDGNVTGINIYGTTASYPSLVLHNGTLPLGNYILTLSDNNNVRYRIFKNGDTLKDSSDPFSFAVDNAEDVYLIIIFTGSGSISNVLVKPMLRLSTETDADFEPYSNICPISGYDETSVVDNGINQWDEEWEVGSINGTTGLNESSDIYIRSKNKIKVSSNETYYFNRPAGNRMWIYGYDVDGNYVFLAVNSHYKTLDVNTYLYTIPENVHYIRFIVDKAYGTTYNNDISINYPSTDTDYHAYQGNTYTLQFGDTVYGAEVDFVNGVATVTKGYIAEYAGETLPSTWISDRDVYVSGTTPTTGAQVVYELATPYTIQLTPQQIKMLKGNNVLVADGDMSLVYQEDSVVGDVKEWAEEHFIPYNTYRTPPVFGFHIDGSDSDPESRVTYIADNANYTPAHMDYTADKFRYNSWRDIWFVKECKPCILNQDGTVKAYLNPNDYTKDIDGNTVVIDENLTDANVMIEFPKIWYKVVPDAGDTTSASVYFSPVKVDEDYKDYAYIDKDGVHKEHFYMPAYNGSVLSGTTVMRSLSGQAVSKNLDESTEIAYAKANGDGWNTEDAGEVMLINFLLILMGKSTDTQTVFGRGIDSGGETVFNNYVTGSGNLKGLFYGTNTGTGLVKVFGIENWWGLQWRRYAGDVLDNGVRKVKLCYGNEDGSTTFDFNIDGTGYVDVGVTPSGTSGGYIRTMKFTHDGMYSAISDGSSSTYFCDGQWFNNAYHTIYAVRGGRSGLGLPCGAFCVALDVAPGYRNWDVGAAVSYK